MAESWPEARDLAIAETDLPVEQVLNSDFWPEP
jgi:hypothetical protein